MLSHLRSKWVIGTIIVVLILTVFVVIYLKYVHEKHIQTTMNLLNLTQQKTMNLEQAYKSLTSNVLMLQNQAAYGAILDLEPQGKLEIKEQHDLDSQESSITTSTSPHGLDDFHQKPVTTISFMPLINNDIINARVTASIDHDIEEIIGESQSNMENTVVELPTVQSPTVQSPTVQSPTVQSPTVELPTVQLQTVQSQTVQSPTVQLPTVQTQVVQSPTVQSPTVQSPTVQTSNSQLIVNESVIGDKHSEKLTTSEVGNIDESLITSLLQENTIENINHEPTGHHKITIKLRK
jgi:hypothetical protein